MNILNRKKRNCYVCIADPHSGHELGLINPDTVLYSKGEGGDLNRFNPVLTPFQDFLWMDVFEPGVEEVSSFAGSTPCTLISLGDLTQGDKYDNGHYLRENQITIATKIFEPLTKNLQVKKIRLIAGTGAHDPQAAPTISVAQNLQASGYDAEPLYHLLINDENYEIDVSHHGPHPGSRTWLRGNVARYNLRDTMNIDYKYRGKAPDLYLRAHRHVLIDEKAHDGEHLFWSRLVGCPPLTGLNDHARKVTNSQFLITVGLFAFIIESGRMVDELWFKKQIDLRTHEPN